VARGSRVKAASGGSPVRKKRTGSAVARSARPPAQHTRPARGARARSAGTLEFWSRDWAQAAKQAWNAGPSAEARAKKIARFWEWIEKAKQHVDCQLALAVDGLPGSGTRHCLLLDLEHGRCTRARLATRNDAEATATYILAASYRDWREIMGGFDLGKAVMYRKLRLEKGEVLVFFKSIYYWTESLACLQRIPTRFSSADTTAN
jgi:hypothetical protein